MAGVAEQKHNRNHSVHSRQPDFARQTAAQVLYAVYENQAYANLSIRQQLDDPRLSSLDRRFATALIYETLSRTYTIDWVIGQISDRPIDRLDPWVRVILRMGVWQLIWSRSIPQSAAIDQAVRLTYLFSGRSATVFVNAVLRKLTRQPVTIPPSDGPLQTGIKPELYGCLRKWYGEKEALALGAAFLRADTAVTVRINPLKTDQETLLRALSEQGIEAVPGRYCPEALSIQLNGQPIAQLSAYQDGWISVQNEAAMLVAYAARPQPDSLIIDLCAAPGGKICHLAEKLDNRAQFLAFDIHAGRLKLIADQAARLGLADSIQCFQANAVPLADQASDDCLINWTGQADLVLADVPCSGLGLLGRKPEIRLTMTYQRMREFEPLQAAILDRAAGLVKPGGVIIYSTCTINPAENIDQINAFLNRWQGRFQLESLLDDLPPSLLEKTNLFEEARTGSIQLLPHRHATDGFFIARLRKERTTA